MPRFSASVTFLYRELPLLARFEAARKDGFDAVEIQSPEGEPLNELVTAVKGAGVSVVLCNAPMGDFLSGGPGLSAVPGRQFHFRKAIASAREMAVALQCRNVHIGPSRVTPEHSMAEQLSILAENLDYAASICANDGINVLIEPISVGAYPDICLSRLDDALRVLQSVDKDNAMLQFDVFHMTERTPDCLPDLEAHATVIGHIQFADRPGRGEPGTGSLDFARLFRVVDTLPYAGHVGAEYQPSASTRESLGWYAPFRNA